MPKIGIRIDGLMILTLLALGAGVYVYARRDDIAAAINPADRNNLVNRGAVALVGEQRLATGFDYLFGAADLINPFNESDAYARKVWGLE